MTEETKKEPEVQEIVAKPEEVVEKKPAEGDVAPVEVKKDEKTLTTESGKELKLNFLDAGDRKKEDKAAEDLGIESKEIKPFKTPAEIVDEKLAQCDMFMAQTQQMLSNANIEISGLITALLRRGLLTQKELKSAIDLVTEKFKEQFEKDKAEANPDIIPFQRKAPKAHGDTGVIEGDK